MKENLLSFKIVAAVVLGGTVIALASSAHAAPPSVRSLALPGANDRAPSGEAVLRGTLVAQDGVTAISSIDRKWDASTGTGTVNEADVTPSGQIASRDGNIERNPDGTFTAHGTMTDFAGHTVNYRETLTRTANGYVAHGTTSGSAGETTSYQTTVAFVGRNELRRTTVSTNPDGTTSTRTETITVRPA